MIDQMEELGWPIGRLRNEMTGLEPEAFSNAGSEIWYRAAELIAKKEVILPHDRIFFEQAINRGREHTPQSKLRAESKDDLRRRGVVSPDRADAVFSCLFVSALKPSFREVGIKFGNAFF
jgi:hypothetical protein